MVNEKVYIGSGKDFETRKRAHSNDLEGGKHFNKHLQRAWNKYGRDNFEFNIVEEVESSMQFDKEQEYIDGYLNSNKELYNIQIDVHSPFKSEPEAKVCIYFCREEGWYCSNEFETFYTRQKYCPSCSQLRQISWDAREEAKREEEEFYELLNQETQNWLSGFLGD